MVALAADVGGGLNVLDQTRKELLEEIESLRKSEDRLRLALSVASDGYGDWNVETGYYSPGGLEMLGDGGVNADVVVPVNFEQFLSAVSELGLFSAVINESPPRGVASSTR